MAQRKFEDREYKTIEGKSIPYKVYYTKGRATAAIEEGECVRLAMEAGCYNIHISKPISAFEDDMYYMSETQYAKFGKTHARSMRYIAYVKCTGPDGREYEDVGSAAPDNVDMLKSYLPEMAVKRARVRCLILALGLKGLNADAEFPEGGQGTATVDTVEQKVEQKKTIKNLFDAMGLKSDEEGLSKKKQLIEDCFGKAIATNKMTVEQNAQFIKFLQTQKRGEDG
jgi:hypothetical protein